MKTGKQLFDSQKKPMIFIGVALLTFMKKEIDWIPHFSTRYALKPWDVFFFFLGEGVRVYSWFMFTCKAGILNPFVIQFCP